MSKKFYTYITAKKLPTLWQKVNALVDDGFVPFESIFTTDNNSYAQAMMKEIPNEMSAMKHFDERHEHYPEMFDENTENDDEDEEIDDEDFDSAFDDKFKEGDTLSGDDLKVVDTNPQSKEFDNGDTGVGLIDDMLRRKSEEENSNNYRYNLFRSEKMPEDISTLMNYLIDCNELQKLFEKNSRQYLNLEIWKKKGEAKFKSLE